MRDGVGLEALDAIRDRCAVEGVDDRRLCALTLHDSGALFAPNHPQHFVATGQKGRNQDLSSNTTGAGDEHTHLQFSDPD
jgi:hypothetical protein